MGTVSIPLRISRVLPETGLLVLALYFSVLGKFVNFDILHVAVFGKHFAAVVVMGVSLILALKQTLVHSDQHVKYPVLTHLSFTLSSSFAKSNLKISLALTMSIPEYVITPCCNDLKTKFLHKLAR